MHLGSWRDVWAPRAHQLLPRRLSGRRWRGQWGWHGAGELHVPEWEDCDTHELLRWPGNGLGRGW